MTATKLSAAIKNQDRLASLQALAERLAEETRTAQGAPLAALAGRLTAVIELIAAIKTGAAPVESALDRIKAQREKRMSGVNQTPRKTKAHGA
jgi:hypothetical protein